MKTIFSDTISYLLCNAKFQSYCTNVSTYSNAPSVHCTAPTVNCITLTVYAVPTSHCYLPGVVPPRTTTGSAPTGSSPLGTLLHGSSGRRSVLSLLTRARAIQQKEQELMEVYQEIPGSVKTTNRRHCLYL